jgi:hypothetical protein
MKLYINRVSVSDVVTRAIKRFRLMVVAVAFWTAIALPFVYIPLLLTGLDHPSLTETFVLLITAHVGSLVTGHRYQQR